MKQLPNYLTLLRILIVPILIASFYIEGKQLYHWVAAMLFLLASITDFFDGYLARHLEAQSNFGKCLDPIADKLLVTAALVMLLHFNEVGKYDVIPAVIILCREVLVSGIREFLAQTNVSLPVTVLAKWKTTVQMLAIFLLLLGVEGPSFQEAERLLEAHLTQFMGRILLWLAALLTIITGYHYTKVGLHHLQQADQAP